MNTKSIAYSVLAAISPLALTGQESKPATPSAPAPPAKKSDAVEKKLKIEKISDDVFALGKIRVNKKTREITFPAVVEIAGSAEAENQTVVEYVLVNPEGKIHESLFLTEIKPSHLNVAYKLLGYKESKHLFRIVNDDFQPQEGYEKATPEQKKHSRFNMQIKWKDAKGKQVSRNINELINNAGTGKAMEAGPWIYGGSFIHNGQFIADVHKDLFAIFTDRASIGNYAGAGREDDTLWFPNPKTMPATGSKVTFSITPFVDKKK